MAKNNRKTIFAEKQSHTSHHFKPTLTTPSYVKSHHVKPRHIKPRQIKEHQTKAHQTTFNCGPRQATTQRSEVRESGGQIRSPNCHVEGGKLLILATLRSNLYWDAFFFRVWIFFFFGHIFSTERFYLRVYIFGPVNSKDMQTFPPQKWLS